MHPQWNGCIAYAINRVHRSRRLLQATPKLHQGKHFVSAHSDSIGNIVTFYTFGNRTVFESKGKGTYTLNVQF